MARPEKVAVVEEVRERLGHSTATLLTEYRGLSVGDLRALRIELRKADAEYQVTKNTLIRIAAREAGLQIPAGVLTGPTAITFCAGDPVATAKILRAFSRQHPALIIKGGILDGEVLSAEEALRLADLASREELLARLAGLFQAVVAQPARLAQASLTKVVRLLAALQEKRVASEPPVTQSSMNAESSEEPPATEAEG
ncbi:MAG: 50S ribosomal protein L10 [Egibacteraceae bacterium]